MPTFTSPIDIANRALQHCGQSLLSLTNGFNDPSDRALQTGSVYDKLRRAELRRNTWRFSIKTAILRPVVANLTQPTSTPVTATQYPTMLLNPELWSSSTTYFVGSVVTDAQGAIWVSGMPDNLNNAPGAAPGWDLYYGPMGIPAWDTTDGTAYMAGDVVYTIGAGLPQVWMSRVNSNSDTPATVQPWSSTAVYMDDAIVSFSAVNYQSVVDLNVNQQPTLGTNAAPPFSLTTTYATGNPVIGSDGFIYTSIGNGNLGNDPTLDLTHMFWNATGLQAYWSTVLTRIASSDYWLNLSSLLKEMPLFLPIGFNVNNLVAIKNIFRLPANYLRRAPQDPKAGSTQFLGAPSGMNYLDWDFQGNYLLSHMSSPIMFRFGADVANVRDMDEMFCEGLACRIAYAVDPKLTQGKNLNAIAGAYKQFMWEARLVNAIETGPEEPPEDDYITARA